MNDTVRPRVAIDAVGGDGAPAVIIEGALQAIEQFDVDVMLVGPERRLRRELARFRPLPDAIQLVDAPDVVGMEDSPVSVLRSKPDSSLSVCARLVRDRRAIAMITAGNTGAAWVAAKSTLGMIEGVERPALAVVLPKQDRQTLLLDVGANLECKAEQLVHFAVMGSLYSKHVLGVADPTVGLMSVGEEENKGGPRIRKQYRVLSSAGVRFVGNVEGRDVFSGCVDVIVTDGFTGNVILKVAEGFGEMVMSLLVDEARRSPMYGAGLLMAKGAFRNLKKKVDYSEYGGAPLLGVNGACLIGHGRSSARAIRNAVRFAANYASSGIVRRIKTTVHDVLEIRRAREAAGER